MACKSMKIKWWPGTELNRRRQPFQGCALPPELPGHILLLRSGTVASCRLRQLWRTCRESRAVETLGACGTAPIITTKLDSLNATGGIIEDESGGERRRT